MDAKDSLTEVGARVAEVRGRIERACARAGRAIGEVRLVAVVKTFGPDAVRAAHDAGVRDFGESYAQDLRDKSAELSDLSDITWHFVGRIQTNKVKYIAGTAGLIHSVDRLATAEAISSLAGRRGLSPIDVLVPVNLGNEASKSGLDEAELSSACRRIVELPGIRLSGLMCLPPWSEDPERSRPHFRRLRELGEEIRGTLGAPEMFHLSMGMSHDLEVAIEEGATLVRVGSALFGSRDWR